jgi:predicted ATPase
MNIISKIEIYYFRSIYSVTLNATNHLNVFVGGNDAGKSNVLRALNLFFNNKTDLNTPYDFSQDITKYRIEEARAQKGRITLWIKITFRNVDKWNSLPDKFYIKKSWDRNGECTTTSGKASAFEKDIKPRAITNFLNKICFHYVPAIRSRDIFAHYMGMIHDCLLNNTKVGLSKSSAELTSTINNAVDEMSQSIQSQLGFESKIEVPQNFRDLFETLDFSTKFGIFDIPLQKRGDGIQARHIPHILDFIAKQDSKHHIWAYEEPENSLEMSNAFKLAEQFNNKFSKENQIFVTTHSPAFYDLSSDKVSKWFTSSEQYRDTEHFASSVATIASNDNKPDDRLGIAELVKHKAKEVYLSNKDLEQNIERLNNEISDYIKPVIVTEGKFDTLILRTAWEKLNPSTDIPFEITSCNTNISVDDEHAGVKKLHAYLDSLLPNEDKIRIGVFDADEAGKLYYNKLKQFEALSNNIKTHNNGKAYALLLPKPNNDRDEYWDTQNICIEFLFKKEHLTQDYIKSVYYGEGGKEASATKAKILDDDLDGNKALLLGFKKDYKFKSNSRKKAFAENQVPSLPPEAFSVFNELFVTIKENLEE